MSEWITCGKPGVVVCRVKNDVDDDGKSITRFFCDEIAEELRGKHRSVDPHPQSNGWTVGSCNSPAIYGGVKQVWLRGDNTEIDAWWGFTGGHHAEAIAQAVNEAAEEWGKGLGVATPHVGDNDSWTGPVAPNPHPTINWEARRWEAAKERWASLIDRVDRLTTDSDRKAAAAIAVADADALIAALRGDKHDA